MIDFQDIFELKDDERLLYCQAVGDFNKVKTEVDDLLFGLNLESISDVNEKIIALIEFVQVIANESPLQGFKKV